MKIKRIITALLLAILLLGALPVAAAERELVCEAMYQVNDTQIVIEFSEPVALNLHGSNYGPYVALRMVNTTGGTTRITNLKSRYYGEIMQWDGTLRYLDSKHDRLIWTFNDFGHCGAQSITDVRNRVGELGEDAYSSYVMTLVMEEVPFTEPATDLAVCNITTEDGEVFLTPTKPTGWEKVIMEPELHFGYAFDEALIEGISKSNSSFHFEHEGSLIAPGELEPLSQEPQAVTVQVIKNDPIVIAAILGGCALVCVILIAVALVIRNKRKAV